MAGSALPVGVPDAAGVCHTLTLLMRTYCHLCEDMRNALLPRLAGTGIGVREVDIDQHPELEARYGELVPVLLDGDEEVCHYFLDAGRVTDVVAAVTARLR